ncbi:Sialin [Amphibalanus amphitrite]|uniref:Sialin n=1 Tax=Amphibalanus amphitrite TaxID=1232801 RepID=A0A6A4WSJ6_AMPAM|nr:Sialin [Amphibalanus amphitrite]
MNTEAETKAQEAGELKYRLFPSVRMIFVMLVGIGVGTMMITRFNVSIAVVCMGEFQWDKTFQGLLLSSYFYGYTAGLVPGGWIADKLPVVLVLLVSIGLQGLWTLVLPVVARTDPYLLLALRALHGLCSSAALPAAQVFARNWSVPVEYTTVFSLCWAFQYLLGGSAYPISSSICQAWGWPAVFYITGAFPLLWMVVGWFVLTSSPDESSICSEDEKRYLASKRLFRVATTKSLSDKNVTQESTPILAIITNRQVLIVIGTFFTNSWFYYALNITLPTFLKETMGVNLTENGFLSGLPTMSMTVGCVAGGKVFQYLLTRWQCSRTNARKIIATVDPLLPSVRFSLVLLVGFGAGIMLITRFNVSIAVVCMVDGTDSEPVSPESLVTSSENNVLNGTTGATVWEEGELDNGVQSAVQQGEFQWDKTFQGLLLSSYFYGYTAALVPAGWLADRLPVVTLILAGIASQGLCTLAFPVVARTNDHLLLALRAFMGLCCVSRCTNDYLLLALRAFMGLCCSVVLPAATVFIRNWSVPVEYATAFAVCFSIQYLFAGAAYPISSSICQAGGWPLVFYVTGALPLLWVAIASFVLTSSPDDSSICSEDEKRYLASKRLCRIESTKSFSDKSVQRPATPLWAILTNVQVWIIVFTFFSHSWFYFALNITLPTFLKETMGVRLTENGILSGLPVMSMTLGVLAGGKIFQQLLTKWHFTRTNARKIMATICPLSAGPDIAPQFAGVIWGLSGSIGNLTGVLAPTVAAAMTPNKTLQEWRYFFLIAVVMSIAMDVIILLFWKSEIQPFAKSDDDLNEDRSTIEA